MGFQGSPRHTHVTGVQVWLPEARRRAGRERQQGAVQVVAADRHDVATTHILRGQLGTARLGARVAAGLAGGAASPRRQVWRLHRGRHEAEHPQHAARAGHDQTSAGKDTHAGGVVRVRQQRLHAESLRGAVQDHNARGGAGHECRPVWHCNELPNDLAIPTHSLELLHQREVRPRRICAGPGRARCGGCLRNSQLQCTRSPTVLAREQVDGPRAGADENVLV